jgi:hypothetical protein
VDYRIRREKSEPDSTGYMEVGRGKYSGRHWQEGFLFIWEDAFGMAEGILAKHVPNYDHFSMTDVPRDVGLKVIAEWRDIAERLAGMSPQEVHAALNLAASYRDRLDSEVDAHRSEIAGMLRELAAACSSFYEREEWVCVLGM